MISPEALDPVTSPAIAKFCQLSSVALNSFRSCVIHGAPFSQVPLGLQSYHVCHGWMSLTGSRPGLLSHTHDNASVVDLGVLAMTNIQKLAHAIDLLWISPQASGASFGQLQRCHQTSMCINEDGAVPRKCHIVFLQLRSASWFQDGTIYSSWYQMVDVQSVQKAWMKLR